MAVKYLVSADGKDHLPVTGEDGKPDHHLMGAAWAALHEGYRGNKYEGPNKAEAIAKLKAMYKSEGIDTPSESASHGELEQRWALIMRFGKQRSTVHLLEGKAVSLELWRRKIEPEALIQDIPARRIWGDRVLQLTVGYLSGVFSIIVLNGFRWHGFHVSDSVLIALIRSTAYVLIPANVVTNYLFPKPK